ncbi:MAG: permease [Candidatus Thermoplasmatota archaeon]|nr:permease [Candidatus Thermoplasmatota archaeon]MBS3789784.1 permease [Candidatus Thermoplasmatota archaeon]
MDITTIGLLVLAASLLIWSTLKNKKKTKKGLGVAKNMFKGIAVQIISILALIGLFLTLVPPETIRVFLGDTSVIVSTLISASFGTVTLIPAFVAFPLAASLVDAGAHVVSMAAFITTLTMVGFITAPIEIEYFGKKFTLVRNVLSFLAAIGISLGMGLIL